MAIPLNQSRGAGEIPETMRAVSLIEPGVLRLEERAVPRVGPGDLLIRVMAATTCGTDVKAFVRGHPKIPMPGPFGHEYSGVVAAAGAAAAFAVGDEVMGTHTAPCLACAWCLRGQENLCETILSTMVLGTYAPYVLIPSRIAGVNVRAKPAGLPFAEASLLEPLACVAQGIEESGFTAGSRVLVLGPGAIGLMFAAALLHSGASEVALAGRNEARLAVGESFGARAVRWDALSAEKDFDWVIECTGQVEVWERSVDFARRGGSAVLFGGPPKGTRVSFDSNRIHYDQIRLISPFHFGTGAVQKAYEWLAGGGLRLGALISGTRKLGQAQETFQELAQGGGIKYAFVP